MTRLLRTCLQPGIYMYDTALAQLLVTANAGSKKSYYPDRDLSGLWKVARVRSVGYMSKYTGGIYSGNTLPNPTGVFGTAAIPYRTLR